MGTWFLHRTYGKLHCGFAFEEKSIVVMCTFPPRVHQSFPRRVHESGLLQVGPHRGPLGCNRSTLYAHHAVPRVRVQEALVVGLHCSKGKAPKQAKTVREFRLTSADIEQKSVIPPLSTTGATNSDWEEALVAGATVQLRSVAVGWAGGLVLELVSAQSFVAVQEGLCAHDAPLLPQQRLLHLPHRDIAEC